MKLYLHRLLVPALLLVLMLSCNKSKSNSKECNITTTSATAPTAGTVRYMASFLGQFGYISSVSYQNGSGVVNVSHPTLPWGSIPISVQGGATIKITVVGTIVTNGTISAGYHFSNGGLNDYGDSVQCAHN